MSIHIAHTHTHTPYEYIDIIKSSTFSKSFAKSLDYWKSKKPQKEKEEEENEEDDGIDDALKCTKHLTSLSFHIYL